MIATIESATPAAMPGEDREWEEFQKQWKNKARARQEKERAEIENKKGEIENKKGANVEEVHGEEPELGTRKPQKMQDPRMPSAVEVAEHELTHVPFRSWCRHCVRGRGKEMPHRKSEEEIKTAEIHMDLCFPGEEDGTGGLTVLVAAERGTKMKLASAMPSKTTGKFIAKRVLAFTREVGVDHGELVIKTDQEPAMKAIVNEVCRLRAAAGGGRTVPEMSPVGQSQSNGIAERTAESVEGQARVLRSALEEVGGQAPGAAPDLSVALRVGSVHLEQVRGWQGRVHGLRKVQGEEIQSGGPRIWRGCVMEEAASRGPLGQAREPLGGRRVFGHEGDYGRNHRGEFQGRVEDEDRAPQACRAQVEHRGDQGLEGRAVEDE